jgi:hypothetical protein
MRGSKGVKMNERIKQLAEQASKEAFPLGSMAWMEKFAELILQECFQACMNEGASYEEKAAGAYQSNLYVTAIKQHFELEEQDTESNEWHTCPYAEEIHGDYETLCDCDEERTIQCRMDI